MAVPVAHATTRHVVNGASASDSKFPVLIGCLALKQFTVMPSSPCGSSCRDLVLCESLVGFLGAESAVSRSSTCYTVQACMFVRLGRWPVLS